MQQKAKLTFTPSAQTTGFTPAGIAAFDDLRPASVVRELVQNSLDAAAETGEDCALVRFHLSSAPLQDVPGIEEYRSAFNGAVRTQEELMNGQLAAKPKTVVQRIQRTLEADAIDVLRILDNGVGLSEKRLTALLSDGVSVKASGATGTYGNGHSTAIPASDIRYLLYAGVTKEGPCIGSGHAVLASHHVPESQFLSSGDGYFVQGFMANEGRPFVFPENEELPSMLAESLNLLRERSSQGAAVIIPAFNHFEEESDSLWTLVSKTAAANFFVAISEGRLRVEVEDVRENSCHSLHVLDNSTLADILAENQSEVRTRTGFLSGQRAFEAYKVYTKASKNEMIDTGYGLTEVYLLEDSSLGRSRVGLCRNGMWITDVPSLVRKLSDQAPFHALLQIDDRNGGEFYDLIRVAEGPLHNEIARTRLSPEQRDRYDKSLSAIIKWLRNHTSKVKSDSYFSPDYLTLDFGDSPGNQPGGRNRSFAGVPVVAKRHPARQLQIFAAELEDSGTEPSGDEKSGGAKNPPNVKRHRRRPTLPSVFQAASRPLGEHRQRIVISCNKDLPQAELRLVIDEALDATCERPAQDRYAPATLNRVTLNGDLLPHESFTKMDEEDGDFVGVRLGELTAGHAYTIEADYTPSSEFIGVSQPSLRIELLNAESSEGDS